MTRRIRIGLAALALLGCGSDASFATKYASDVPHDGITVSLFGTYTNGRMSADASDDLASRLAAALGSAVCEAEYTEAFVKDQPDVASLVDDRTRADGVSDELLTVFAPAATGDAILLLSIAGHPPQPRGGTQGAQAPSQSVSPSRVGRGGMGGGGAAPSPRSSTHVSHDALEMTASLFSVQQHRTIGVVAMTYTGTSAEEGTAAFFAKLRTELPRVKCAGWKHDVRFDPDRVRTARPSE